MFKNCLTCSIVEILFAVISFAHATLPSQPIDKTVLLDTWAQKDMLMSTNTYQNAISFQMIRPAVYFDPNQGLEIANCLMTRKNGAIVMKITFNYEKLPIYVPSESIFYRSSDYDEDGRLIVWRNVEKYIYSNHKMNKTIRKTKIFFANPDGTVDAGNDYTLVDLYPVGHPDSTYELAQFNWATGRGYSSDISNITSATILPSNKLNIKANALLSKSIAGSWDLTIEPSEDNLVRNGIFKSQENEVTILEVKTTGTVTRNGLKYASFGVVKSTVSEISVEINDEQLKTDDIYNEVLTYMKKPLDPQKTSIIDNRGEKPVMRKPTEEELQSP